MQCMRTFPLDQKLIVIGYGTTNTGRLVLFKKMYIKAITNLADTISRFFIFDQVTAWRHNGMMLSTISRNNDAISSVLCIRLQFAMVVSKLLWLFTDYFIRTLS